MSKKTWHVHMSGQTLGPLTTEAVKTMLSQMRLHFVDYIWAPSFTKWVRINEVDDFIALMPSYPQQAIPGAEDKEQSEEAVAPKKIKQTPTAAAAKPKKISLQKPASQEKTEPDLVTPKPASINARSTTQAPPPVEVPAKKVWPKERRNIRVKMEGGVKISDVGEYVVVDISEGGIFVKAEKNLEIGTELKFAMRSNLTKEILHLTGVVIRHGISHGEQGFAIEFTRLNPSYKRLIKEYVAQFDDGE